MSEEQVPDTIEKLYDRLDDYDKQQLMNYGYLMEYTRTLEKEVKYQNDIVIKQKELLDKIKEIITSEDICIDTRKTDGSMDYVDLKQIILELLEETK